MSRTLLHLIPVVLALGFVAPSLGNELDPSLVGWWKFDEGSGTAAADSSGQGRDGVLVSNPVWRKDGARNGCLFFDGDLAHVRIAHHDSLNPRTGSFTILFWANVDPVAGTRGDTTWDLVTNKRDTGSVGYYVGAQRTQGGAAGRTGYRFMLGDTSAARKDTPFTPAPLGEWVFVAAVLDREQNTQKISVDGGANWQATTPPAGPIAPAQDFAIGWDIGPNNYWFRGLIDDVVMFGRALSNEEIGLIMNVGMTPGLARAPQPGDGAADVLADTILNWEPGMYAATHDVYFGTSPADVAGAGRANPLGVLVSQGQAETTYDAGPLAFGQTYYWRIDEVNAAPDNTIFKGDVWSFTVEPFAYPIANVTATASSSQPGMEPQNAVNGSGLDNLGQHSTVETQMWMSAGTLPNWIQFEFDKIYKLHELRVWNSNQLIESFLGFGAKSVTIEYSADGQAWTALEGVPEFAQASGTPTYTANTTVALGGVMAKFVKLTINGNWGGVATQTGLSEVRFLYVPIQASEPEPADGATDVSVETELDWRPGREATSHVVYVATDGNAVAAGIVSGRTVTDHGYTPTGLMLGTEYFWKVDEVGATGTYPGDVWSFMTEEYLVVDDFESYTDNKNAGEAVFQTWIDGWDNKTGSQVGYLEAPFSEETIVHGGGKSMPLTYSNTASPFRSEAERSFDEPQDWTAHGIGALTVHFRGALDNSGQLYVKINNVKVPYNGDAGDVATLIWQPWSIDLPKVSTNLKKVSSLTIGIEGANAAGILYIDDIRLYPKAPETTTAVEPNRANLVVHYALDGDATDSSWNGYHGQAVGGGLYVAGVRGQAMEFDGADDHVRIAHHDALNPSAGNFTISFWGYLHPSPGTTGTTNWDLAVAKRNAGSVGYYVGADRNQGSATQAGYKFMLGDTSAKRVDTPYVLAPLGEWVFVAAVLDRDNNVHRISVDGGQTWSSSIPPAGGIAPVQDLAIGWDIGVKNFCFHGTIDEVRIYNQALSDEEIAWLAVN